ncbi:MAG: hypothetical protein KF861_14055 [Planctomycetaceae bacterium]|nr:hypothetical protein [Planctomycetaceae bacterium]
MRWNRTGTTAGRLMLLFAGGAMLAPACFGDEVIESAPYVESELFDNSAPYGDSSDYANDYQDSGAMNAPPPKVLPDYATRPKMQGHFPQPTRRFSLFESWTSFGDSPRERCMPEMFSPRGVGIARRTSCERMDYSPYVTRHEDSSHGPSYYNRIHLFPCRHPHHCEKQGCRCGWSVYY